MGDKRHPTGDTPTEGDTMQGDKRQATAGEVVALWMTRDEACSALGCSTRTLQRKVVRGEVERRQVGRHNRYRLGGQATPATPRGDTRQATPDNGHTTSDKTTGDTRHDLAPLVALIERLTDRVAELERERAEAVMLGHMAVNDRDHLAAELAQAVDALARANEDVRRLHNLVEQLTDAVVETSRSPLALPVRGRLRAILAT